MANIIFENQAFRLEVGEDAKAKSLVIKENGEECLDTAANISMFSVTQERPYNNENKLIYMNKRTTFFANRVRLDGDKLIVGFEITPYEAVVKVDCADEYLTFTLLDFIVHETDYEGIIMSLPPVSEFRLMALPIKNREFFGKWLNVVWDESCATALIAPSAHTRIDAERRDGFRILTADAVSGIKLRGASAILTACKKCALLDAVDKIEHDFDLPLGVESRRSDIVNASIYWTGKINPKNVDYNIEKAKRGGFRLMLINYKAIFHEFRKGWSFCGDYDYNEEYPNGAKDLEAMLRRIREAGIIPGIHFLHTHIGLNTRYVTPRADRRLSLTRRFTLAKPLSKEDSTIYVDENPVDTVMVDKKRVLKFGTELISYTSYTTKYPYAFLGCERGAYATDICEHEEGQIGGILDISEYMATSAYINQNSDLQDEIADKIAAAYNLGFEFVYYDGSEGANPPYEYHIPNAQYRVYKKLKKKPLFAEGAAKAHFGWHILSGANAFDVFPTSTFKRMIDRFPVTAAKEMRQDFTRVNFGWWQIFPDTQPDTYEYGMSRAAAWDCPATIMFRDKETLDSVPRLDDIMEVIRRWEDVRAKKWLTDDMKALMRDTTDEYTLIIDENGKYQLVRYYELEAPEEIGAFIFEYGKARYVAIWHKDGEGKLTLMLPKSRIKYLSEVFGEELEIAGDEGSVTFAVNSKKYIKTTLSEEKIRAAFKAAKEISEKAGKSRKTNTEEDLIR